MVWYKCSEYGLSLIPHILNDMANKGLGKLQSNARRKSHQQSSDLHSNESETVKSVLMSHC